MVAFPLDMTGSRPRVVGQGRALTEEGAVASMPSLSPDGSKLAYELSRPGMDRSELWVTEIDGETRELLTTNARAPVWSRDGTKVAYTHLRMDDSPPLEAAVAYRQLGGTERFLTPWSDKFNFVPTGWTPDGDARAERPERILLSSPAGAQLWCSSFSPVLAGLSLPCPGGATAVLSRGQTVGEPFALTHFDSPKMAISPYIDDSYLGISPRHAVLQMITVTGSIWMLENVDR